MNKIAKVRLELNTTNFGILSSIDWFIFRALIGAANTTKTPKFNKICGFLVQFRDESYKQKERI